MPLSEFLPTVLSWRTLTSDETEAEVLYQYMAELIVGKNEVALQPDVLGGILSAFADVIPVRFRVSGGRRDCVRKGGGKATRGGERLTERQRDRETEAVDEKGCLHVADLLVPHLPRPGPPPSQLLQEKDASKTLDVLRTAVLWLREGVAPDVLATATADLTPEQLALLQKFCA